MWLFLLHDTTNHLQALYQNFRILTQVVAEKSLTEKSLQTDKHTNIITKRQKLYTPCIL